MAAFIVGVWLLLQLLPLPKSLASPIWSDAEAALGTWIPGSITVDPGATVVAFCRYCSAIAVVIVATAVTIDRERAGKVLLWLLAAACIVAALQSIDSLILSRFLDAATDVRIRASTPALCALGLLTALSASVGAIERRYEKSLKDLRDNLIAIAPLLAGFGICGICLLVFGRQPVGMAAFAGLATFLTLLVVRRLGFGAWTGNTVAGFAILVVIVIAIVFADFHTTSTDIVLRYAPESASSSNSMTQRMIADAGWAGTGAGTFELLLPIYGGASGLMAPTAAAKLSAELGAPAFWALLAMAVVLVFMLVQGSLERGRDWVYPAFGAASIVLLGFEAFCDASLFSTSVMLYAAVALGPALSQRLSRVERR
jgi:hypothetical protein